LQDNQAICRLHRIGQAKPVYVYRLVAADTTEEEILSRQLNKQAMFLNLVDMDPKRVEQNESVLKEMLKVPSPERSADARASRDGDGELESQSWEPYAFSEMSTEVRVSPSGCQRRAWARAAAKNLKERKRVCVVVTCVLWGWGWGDAQATLLN
jgi:hypothetical protein